MIARPTRADLQRALPNAGPSLILALDALFGSVIDNDAATTTGAAATQALQDATVVTLSPNDALTNERVLAQGSGIRITDNGAQIIISLAALLITGSGRLGINLNGDANLTVIQSGTVMIEEAAMADLGDFANDAAAASGGVPVSGLYRTGNAVQVRVS